MGVGFTGLGAWIACAVFVLNISSAVGNVNCGFDRNFCDWVPTPSQLWTTTTGPVNGIKPPTGSRFFAAAISDLERWAELYSSPVVLDNETVLTFSVIQQRAELDASSAMVEVYIVPLDGGPPFVIWSEYGPLYKWTDIRVPVVYTGGPFKLRFDVKVGSSRQTAGLAKIQLANLTTGDQEDFHPPNMLQVLFPGHFLDTPEHKKG